MLVACNQATVKPSQVVGSWVAQQLINGESSPADEQAGSQTLVFKSDGTFTGEMSTRVMMRFDATISGTYKELNGLVVLSGTMAYEMDDGYKKSKDSGPYAKTLKVERDRLTEIDNKETLITTVYRRQGEAPFKIRKPKIQPAKSTPEAGALIKKVELTYKNLKTYSDEGTLASTGKGFGAKVARFTTRFSKDGLFCFKVEQLREGKPFQTDAVWGDQNKSWLGNGTGDGAEERPLANGLSILTVGSGIAGTMVSSMLMPEKVGPSVLSMYAGYKLLPNQTFNGHGCHLIEGYRKPDSKLKIWIDDKTMLIIKVEDSMREMEINYVPKINVAIPKSEFTPKP